MRSGWDANLGKRAHPDLSYLSLAGRKCKKRNQKERPASLQELQEPRGQGGMRDEDAGQARVGDPEEQF